MNIDSGFLGDLARLEVVRQVRGTLKREFPEVNFELFGKTSKDDVSVEIAWRAGPNPVNVALSLRRAQIHAKDGRPLGKICCERLEMVTCG